MELKCDRHVWEFFPCELKKICDVFLCNNKTRKDGTDFTHDLIIVFMFSMKVRFFLLLTKLINLAIVEIVCTVIDKVASSK